jgi:hypothetical protein
VDTLERLGVPYMLVGSMASSTYGDPRSTLDIDIVVDLGLDQVDSLCDAFPAGENFYVSPDAARTAVSRGGQFNVIHYTSAGKIDFMIARRDAWGKTQLERRQREWIVPGVEGYVASPEDVIIAKLWYHHEGGSDKHLRDIAGILKAGNISVDTAYIKKWTSQLDLTQEWNAVLQRIGQPPTTDN